MFLGPTDGFGGKAEGTIGKSTNKRFLQRNGQSGVADGGGFGKKAAFPCRNPAWLAAQGTRKTPGRAFYRTCLGKVLVCQLNVVWDWNDSPGRDWDFGGGIRVSGKEKGCVKEKFLTQPRYRLVIGLEPGVFVNLEPGTRIRGF